MFVSGLFLRGEPGVEALLATGLNGAGAGVAGVEGAAGSSGSVR